MGEFQFERVVDVGAQREQELAGEDGADADGGGGEDQVRAVLSDDHIDEAHRHAGQHQHQRGASHRHHQRERALQRKAEGVAENPREDGHATTMDSNFRVWKGWRSTNVGGIVS